MKGVSDPNIRLQAVSKHISWNEKILRSDTESLRRHKEYADIRAHFRRRRVTYEGLRRKDRFEHFADYCTAASFDG